MLAWVVATPIALADGGCAPVCARFAEAVGVHDAMQAVARSGTRLVAVGSKGAVLVSDDAGVSWSRDPLPGRPPLIDAAACPDGRFYLLDFRRGVWARDDAGVWVRSAIDPGPAGRGEGRPPPRSLGLRCDPAGRLWAVGEDSSILRSDDGGGVWRAMYDDHSDRLLTAVGFVDDARVRVVGEFGSYLESDDGGASWHEGPRLPDDLYPHALHVAVDAVLWCVANTGLIYRLDPGADGWVREPAGTARALFGIAAVDGRLLAVGAGATALVRDPGGGAETPGWRALRLLPRRAAARDWRGLVALGDGAWLAVGEAGLASVPAAAAGRLSATPALGEMGPAGAPVTGIAP